MAPGGCTLDDSGLGEQLDRYRRLAATAVTVQDGDAGLVIIFGVEVDVDLLAETVAVERGCCSFFTLDYDVSMRRLSIGIDDPSRVDALAALASALRDDGRRLRDVRDALRPRRTPPSSRSPTSSTCPAPPSTDTSTRQATASAPASLRKPTG